MRKLNKLFAMMVVLVVVLKTPAKFYTNVHACPVTVTEESLERVKSGESEGFYINEIDDSFVYFKSPEEYVIDCNIEKNLIFDCNNGEIILNLNGKTIDGYIWVKSRTKLTINGPGEVVGGVTFDRNTSATINGGTYKGGLEALYESNLVINDAIVNSSMKSAVALSVCSSLEINAGQFTSDEHSAIITSSLNRVSINGGEFTGKTAGLDVYDYNGLNISGGRFKAKDVYEPGVPFKSAIVFRSYGDAIDETAYKKILAVGHIYDSYISPRKFALQNRCELLLVDNDFISVVSN